MALIGIFSGEVSFTAPNGTPVWGTTTFAGAIGHDGKTLTIIENEGRYSSGSLIAPDEMEIIFRGRERALQHRDRFAEEELRAALHPFFAQLPRSPRYRGYAAHRTPPTGDRDEHCMEPSLEVDAAFRWHDDDVPRPDTVLGAAEDVHPPSMIE